ncbi:MAG: MerR family transcriptional regulator [Clostridia bacterium]|nr:MerR family transcriptional regulator [Clostridia bacterium]
MTEKISLEQLATILQVDVKLLRVWEHEFSDFIRTNKDKVSRKYDENQVETFMKIKELLHAELYTLNGAKRRLELDRSLSSALGIDHNFKTTVFFMFSAIMEELQNAREESRNLAKQLELLRKQKLSIEEQLFEEQNKGLLEFFRGKMKKNQEHEKIS